MGFLASSFAGRSAVGMSVVSCISIKAVFQVFHRRGIVLEWGSENEMSARYSGASEESPALSVEEE